MTTKKVSKAKPEMFESQKVSQQVHGGGSFRIESGKPVKQEPAKPTSKPAE